MGTVLVTGGTGVLGRDVTRRLTAAGHTVRVLSRNMSPAPPAVQVATGDLRTGAGLGEATTGVDAIVHCASDPRNFTEVDVDGTARLLAAARRSGVTPHLVYISIVGVDRIPWAYYRAKLAAERLIAEAGLPWTVQRTTQFHEFTLDLLRRVTRLPVVPAPRGWRIQSVDVREVAARLTAAVDHEPAGRLPDLGGPQILAMADVARSYLRAVGRRRPVVTVAVPGRFSASARSGANLVPGHRATGRTWDDFLADAAPADPRTVGTTRKGVHQ
jgi:uncharacterized protein YbjT (DUF2867 family)